MALYNTPLEELTAEDIQALVSAEIPEGVQIDYKLQLPGNGDEDKREFLADISSFANGQGGDLVYGIREEQGRAVEIVELSLDLEHEILRLMSIARTGIDPRIPALTVRGIPVRSGFVVVVRARRSWLLPHMVTFKNYSRFFVRGAAGKHQLDVSELRSLFRIGAESERFIRAFRSERLAHIVSDTTPVRLTGKHRVVLHLVPLSGASLTERLGLEDFEQRATQLRPPRASGSSWRHNLDGFVCYTGRGEGAATGYAQIFRNGAIEAVETSLLEPDSQGPYIPSVLFEQDLLECVSTYLKLLKEVGVAPPLVAMLTLLNVQGFRMAGPGPHYRWDHHTIDRSDVLSPEALVTDYSVSYTAIVKDLVDPVWNASGWAKSPFFHEDGTWRGR